MVLTRRVVRVEDSGMWADYVAKREIIAARREVGATAKQQPRERSGIGQDVIYDAGHKIATTKLLAAL